MIELDEVYPMVFYGGSAVFTVMAIAILGFDYLEDMSKFTIASTIFAIFVASLLIATTRETLLRTVFYLTSAGSYLLFLVYIIRQFSRGTGDTIVFFLLSAGLFSAIGHVLTSRPDLIPETDTVRNVLIGLTAVIALLMIYNISFVTLSFSVSMEDTVTFNDSEQKIGEIEVTKKGYLPVEASGSFVEYCLRDGDLPSRYRRVGDKSFGFAPETYSEEILFDLDERFFEEDERPGSMDDINITEGTELEVVRIDSCSDNTLEENQLGVAVDER